MKKLISILLVSFVAAPTFAAKAVAGGRCEGFFTPENSPKINEAAYDSLVSQRKTAGALAYHNILRQIRDQLGELVETRDYLKSLPRPSRNEHLQDSMHRTVIQSQFLRLLQETTEFMNSYGIGYGHLPGGANFFQNKNVVEEVVNQRQLQLELETWGRNELKKHFDYKRVITRLDTSNANAKAQIKKEFPELLRVD